MRKAVKASPREDLPGLLAQLELVRAEAFLSVTAEAPPPGPRVLTPADVAQRLGKGVDWAYRKRASLPTVILPGGRWGVPEASLERWIKRRGA